MAWEETRCRHYMGYSFRLVRNNILYVISHRQDSTYHIPCYISRGALAGTRNSSMGPPWRIDPTTHRTMFERSTTELQSLLDEVESRLLKRAGRARGTRSTVCRHRIGYRLCPITWPLLYTLLLPETGKFPFCMTGWPEQITQKSTPIVQWLSHRLVVWYVVGSLLGTGSNTVRTF